MNDARHAENGSAHDFAAAAKVASLAAANPANPANAGLAAVNPVVATDTTARSAAANPAAAVVKAVNPAVANPAATNSVVTHDEVENPAGAHDEAAKNASAYPLAPLASVVPHRGAMLLLDAVQRYDDASITATARVDRHAWYANGNGDMPAWIGLELMAQAIAAHVGLMSMRAGQRARPGVLLGSRQYTAHVAALRADAPLEITAVELLRGADGQGAYACSIRQCAQGHAQTALHARRAQDGQGARHEEQGDAQNETQGKTQDNAQDEAQGKTPDEMWNEARNKARNEAPEQTQNAAQEIRSAPQNSAQTATRSEAHGATQPALLCAEAIIKVYQPPDFQAFIEERLQP